MVKKIGFFFLVLIGIGCQSGSGLKQFAFQKEKPLDWWMMHGNFSNGSEEWFISHLAFHNYISNKHVFSAYSLLTNLKTGEVYKNHHSDKWTFPSKDKKFPFSLQCPTEGKTYSIKINHNKTKVNLSVYGQTHFNLRIKRTNSSKKDRFHSNSPSIVPSELTIQNSTYSKAKISSDSFSSKLTGEMWMERGSVESGSLESIDKWMTIRINGDSNAASYFIIITEREGKHKLDQAIKFKKGLVPQNISKQFKLKEITFLPSTLSTNFLPHKITLQNENGESLHLSNTNTSQEHTVGGIPFFSGYLEFQLEKGQKNFNSSLIYIEPPRLRSLLR